MENSNNRYSELRREGFLRGETDALNGRALEAADTAHLEDIDNREVLFSDRKKTAGAHAQEL